MQLFIYYYLLHSETGATGQIMVNGKNRSSNSENFRNVSAYIHQDDALRPYLTVCEAMTVAAHLKLGFKVTKEYKMQLVSKVIRIHSSAFAKRCIFCVLILFLNRFIVFWSCLGWKRDFLPSADGYLVGKRSE